MAKKQNPTRQTVQAVMLELGLNADVVVKQKYSGSNKKNKASLNKESRTDIGLGDGSDFSEYIKKGRGNNISWKK